MSKNYRISSFRARSHTYTRPAGHPTLEVTEAELAAILGKPTGKRGRPAAPRRHLDADLRYCHHLRGERCDAAGRSFDICRTLIFTRHGKPVADATITRVEALPHFTRVHFCAAVAI